MKTDILELMWKHKYVTGIVLGLLLLLVSLFMFLSGSDQELTRNFFLGGGLLIVGTIVYAFIQFYTSEARLEQEITSFHGRNFISTFYRIYFPVAILSVIVTVIISLALIPEAQGGWGVLDREEVSPSGMITFIVPGIITALGIMALADYDMKKKNLRYSQNTNKSSLPVSIFYGLPLLGIYFGVTFFTRFFLEQAYGVGVLIPSFSNVYEVDAGLVRAARFWLFLNNTERQLVLVGFVLVYISTEIILRGLMARESEGYGLKAGGIVFVPAIVQAAAFSNGAFAFSDPIFYFYKFFETFVLGVVLGITLWRTGRFSSVLILALLARALNTQEEFQSVILQILPKAFGEYNPIDNVQTTADTLGIYLVYFQIALVVTSPFILIVSYEEVGRVLSRLWTNLKAQWFGYLVIAIAFFLIDLVFSLISDVPVFGPILGFFVALIIIGIVLSFLFKVLPDPEADQMVLRTQSDMFNGELPLDVKQDITFLESRTKWYEHPIRIGILSAGLYVYFLFISGTYRQITPLEGLDIVKFVTFLLVLPTVLIGFAGYFFSRSLSQGYFFAENWRSTLYIILTVVLVINIYIWTEASATVLFKWRNIPFFIPFALLIWPKPVSNATKDYALGLARSGRYATMKWTRNHENQFGEVFEELKDLPSDNIQAGAYILAAQHGLVDETQLMDFLRSSNIDRGQRIGAILGLGLTGSKSAEGLLLDNLDNEDDGVLLAAYWSLGRVGSRRALNKMAKTLEENPRKSLISIAEEAILSIDPNYPLAGIRDSIVVSTN